MTIDFPIEVGQAFQGDIGVFLIDSVPDGLGAEIRISAVVVGHSETGHFHCVVGGRLVAFEPYDENKKVCYLRIDSDYADLVHNRPVNPHETIRLLGGGRIYKIVQQQEWTPEGWRAVVD